MFHSFFQFPSEVEILIIFAHSFSFILWSAGTAKSTILKLLFFCWLLLGLGFWPRLCDPFVCLNPIGVSVCHFSGQLLVCAYTICSYGRISIPCTFPSESHWRPSHVYSYTPSVQICSIHLLCDWWFCLYHHITYICYLIVSYLFLLWYDWFLWSYFVLLLGEIIFLF